MDVKLLECFKYGRTEMDYLKSRDEQLGRVIDRIGVIRRELTPELFEALIFSVVGQQIAPKAAKTVYGRLEHMLGAVSPQSVYDAKEDEIRSCGLSGRKAGYIKGIADAVIGGRIDLDALKLMPDDAVITRLSSLPGIGVWTAEMLMIFSMGRPDIVSFGDLAIRRGMMRVYGLDQLKREQFLQYRHRYSPYGTVASFYLWAAPKGE